MAGDGCADCSGVAGRISAEDGEVDFFGGSGSELFGESEVYAVCLGHDHAAAGFFVEAMDNTGAGHAANPAEASFAMMQQRVNQRVFLVAGGGMDDESWRFVEDEQIVILEKNVQRNVFRLSGCGPGFGPDDFYDFSEPGVVCGFDPLPVDRNVAPLYEALDGATGDDGEMLAQVIIESFGRERLFDNDCLFTLAQSRDRLSNVAQDISILVYDKGQES